MHFDADFTGVSADGSEVNGKDIFKAELLHFFSLMHGLALQNLRNDWCGHFLNIFLEIQYNLEMCGWMPLVVDSKSGVK